MNKVDGTLDQELDEEEKHIQEMLRNTLHMTGNLEPVNLRCKDKKKERVYKPSKWCYRKDKKQSILVKPIFFY